MPKTKTTKSAILRISLFNEHFFAEGTQKFVGSCAKIFLAQIKEKYAVRKMVDGDLYVCV